MATFLDIEFFKSLKLDEVPDFSKADWKQLIHPEGFRWIEGVTPLSEPQFPIYAVLFYLISVFCLKFFMNNKKPIEMSNVSAIHNLFLCILSIFMSFGQLYSAITRGQDKGWACLVCEKDGSDVIQGMMYYWGLIYYYSKYYELLDTYIIVLRKNPITFLHVYHHAAMVCLTRLWLSPGHPLAWWSIWLNSLVHVPMYWFYFKKSLGMDVWWKKYITKFQLIQFSTFGVVMVIYFVHYIGVFQSGFSFWDTLTGDNGRCVGPLYIVYMTMIFNASLLFLFSRFYVRTYKENPSQVRKDKMDQRNFHYQKGTQAPKTVKKE